jgi:hypothetical protein
MRHLAFLAFLFVSSATAAAGEISSAYSNFNLNKCKADEIYNSRDEGGGGVWSCKGIKGYDVLYFEGDLRGNIAFGPKARSQCTSAQSFGAFNSPGAKIEWRLDKGVPFATILRWTTDNGLGEAGSKQNWLVVTKLNGADACRTAVVDTKFPNANAVARDLADKKSLSFNCAKDMPQVISQASFKVDQIMSYVPCPGGPYREE